MTRWAPSPPTFAATLNNIKYVIIIIIINNNNCNNYIYNNDKVGTFSSNF